MVKCKKLLSLFMCVMMVLSLLPTPAVFAADDEELQQPEISAEIAEEVDAETPPQEPSVETKMSTLESMQTLTDSNRLVVETNGGLPDSIGGEAVEVGSGAFVVEFESAAERNGALAALMGDGNVTTVSSDVEFSIDGDGDEGTPEDTPAETPADEPEMANELVDENDPAADAVNEETLGDESPVEEVPSEEIPAEEIPTDETPTNEIPEDENLEAEIPGESEPSDEGSIEEVPVEETPVEEEPVVEIDYRAVAGGRPLVAVIDTGSNSADAAVSIIDETGADGNGHGTRMTDLIRANAGSSNPFILSIKALNYSGAGNMSDVYAAIQYAINQRVDYINLSISADDSENMAAIKSAIQSALNAGITVVASAGNAGGNAGHLVPANIDGVVTCGAVNDNNVVISNYGDCVDYFVRASSSSNAAAIVTGKLVSGFDMDSMTPENVELTYPNGDSDSFARYGDVFFHVNYSYSGSLTYSSHYGDVTSYYWLPPDWNENTIYNVIFLEWSSQDTGSDALKQGFGDMTLAAMQAGKIPPTILVEMNTSNYSQGVLDNYWNAGPMWGDDLNNLISAVRNKFSNTYLNEGCACDVRAHIMYDGHSQGAVLAKYIISATKHIIGMYAYSGSVPYPANGADAAYWDYRGETVDNNDVGRQVFQHLLDGIASHDDDCICKRSWHLAINKKSENPALTNGNPCYNLDGAVFGVFESAEDAASGNASKALETQTIANGTATFATDLKCDVVYYVRELSVPEAGHYQLNTTVYSVTSDEGDVTIPLDVENCSWYGPDYPGTYEGAKRCRNQRPEHAGRGV